MQFRSMLRFTLRDLFWLTLVVASLLGWWVDRGHVGGEQREALRRDARHWYEMYLSTWTKADWLADSMRTAGWTVDLHRDTPPFADPPPAVP